jgi:hypothetical protein
MSLFVNYPHHSASSINSFIEYRPKWFLEKFRGIRMPGNAAMHRGTAVEHGLNHFFKEQCSYDDAQAEGLKKFNELCLTLTPDPEMTASIKPCVLAAIQHFDNDDHPWCSYTPVMQGAFLQNIEELDLPIKGYFDYLWKDDEIIKQATDLKCVNKTPPQLKQSYIIQGALYRHITKAPVEFVFIIPLKKEVKVHTIKITDEDYEWGMRQIRNYGAVIERIIKLPIDQSILADCFVPNPAEFYNDVELLMTMNEFGL